MAIVKPQASITINSIDESTKTIYYTFSYSADYDPEPNEESYRNGDVGYMYANINREENGSTSYQAEYDSGLSSKTIEISYTYHARYIKRTQADKVYEKLFNTNAEASNYVNEQANPEDYLIETTSMGYAVYKITYTYTVATDPAIQQGSASATANFKPKETYHTISAGEDYITIRFYNYLSTDKLTIKLRSGQSASRYGSGSITIQGLEPGLTYVGDIYLNDTALIETFAAQTTGTSTSTDPYIMNYGSNNEGTEIFVVVDRTKSTYTANISINGKDEGLYGCTEGNTIYNFPAEPNNTYIVVIVINGIELTAKITTTTSTGEFQWKTKIYKDAKMNTRQNSINGAIHPAPVTAEEWNILVTLVNAKRSTSIPSVSPGSMMNAAPGGNVRQVADALGVKVDKGDRITAEFFLALQDAINNI